THARSEGDALADADEREWLAPRRAGERGHRTRCEILAVEGQRVSNLQAFVRRDTHVIGEVERDEHASQLVIAVVALADDGERERLARATRADGRRHGRWWPERARRDSADDPRLGE